jgi:hypothetical protein
MKEIVLQADVTDSGEPLHHFWSTCVGAGRANEGLRANWQDALKTAVKDCGFRYLRFHGLFHDDMTAELRKSACATKIETLTADQDGRFQATLTMAPWSLVSVREADAT